TCISRIRRTAEQIAKKTEGFGPESPRREERYHSFLLRSHYHYTDHQSQTFAAIHAQCRCLHGYLLSSISSCITEHKEHRDKEYDSRDVSPMESVQRFAL